MDSNETILYHYTSILGLYGIIGCRGIRFSEFREANDPRERCGICEYRYISFTADGIVEGWANPLMWYMYGYKYGGVCIGFNKNKLLQLNKHLQLEDFPIVYGAKDLPSVTLEGILPMKYKLSVWNGENEYRIINKSKQEFLKIDIDCIEHIYFLSPSSKRFSQAFGELHTIGLNNKMTNIGFCNGDIITIPIQRCNGVGGFATAPSGKIKVAILGNDTLSEQDIYQRCKYLYDFYSSGDCTVSEKEFENVTDPDAQQIHS